MYKSLMQILADAGLRKRITHGDFRDLLKAYSAGDVTSGDVLRIDGEEYFFDRAGINIYNGTGIRYKVAYLVKPGAKTLPVINTYEHGPLKIPRWEKITHMTREEWDKKLEERI